MSLIKDKEVTQFTSTIINSFVDTFVMLWERQPRQMPTGKELKAEAEAFISEWLILNDAERKHFLKRVETKIPTLHANSEEGFKK